MTDHRLGAARRTAALLAFLVLAAGPASPKDAPQGATFTIAVIPDTQNYIDYSHQRAAGFPFDASTMFLDQMRFVADHLRSQGGDIAFVTAMGDVWQHQTLKIDPGHEARGFKRVPNPFMDQEFAPTEMTKTIEIPMAKRGYDLIAGKTPFSVVPGNHDYDAMWTDASHPPEKEFKTMASLGELHAGGLDNFRSVFSDHSQFFRSKPWYVASHDGGADSAQIFKAGGYRFLHIGLQFDPPNASLLWAQSVIKQHPGLPTIVSTHDFLETDGQRIPNPIIDNHLVDPQDNTPQMVWDKLISQNDQIFLVLCGHEHGQAFRADDNRFGHKVYQVLADYQSRHHTADVVGYRGFHTEEGLGDGWMRLMTFDMAAPTPRVHVHTYSTVYNKESRDVADYAAWYKRTEKPLLSDDAFSATDDYSFDLNDFRMRFRQTSP
jgi:hypothetical protein